MRLTLSLYLAVGWAVTTYGQLVEKDGFTTCERNYVKVGCFKDSLSNRPLREMLVNDRDKHSKYFDGHLISWRQWEKSMHSLACRCADKAKEKGYQYFGLQFYGECWSDPEGPSRFYKDGRANPDRCFQELGQDGDCDMNAEQECVGKQAINYVYRVQEKSKTTTDGGYSEWSEWSDCSKSCDKGIQFRERTCTNPVPSPGGKDCTELGEADESRFCNTQKCEKACKKAMDLGIIIDSSSSVKKRNFPTVKEFVHNITKEFEVGSNGTHVGVVVYNHKARLVFDFKKYSEEKDILDAVDGIKYKPGGTRTDLALKLAKSDLFSEKGGYRPSNPHILVVLTDGKTHERLSEPYPEVLKPLQDVNVKIIAVGVGDQISESELKEIALGKEENVLLINNFRDMVKRVHAIVGTICGQAKY